MSKWKRVPVTEVCELIVDCVNKTAPSVDYETPYKMIRTPNIKGGRVDLNDCRFVEKETFEKWTRRATVENDDVLLTREAPMGEVGIVNTKEKVFLGQRIMQYRANKEVMNPRFLLYSFLSRDLQNQFRAHDGSGSVVSHIRVPDCLKFEINVPPLEEQNRIVDILGSIDDKIELNHQINQTLEQIAQAIFKSWFVDFEPVKAKIEAKQNGQDPERAAMRAISGKTDEQLDQLNPEQRQQLTTTAAHFPDELEDSELGEIPKGWLVNPFGELLEKTIGGDWGKEEPDKKHTEKVRILRGTDLPNVYVGNDDSVPVRYVESKKLESRKLEDGDIVIEVSGGSPTQPTGRSLYITQDILDRLDGVVEPASFCRLFRPVNKGVGLLLSVHLAKIYSDGKTWLYQNQSTGISNFQTKIFLDREMVILPNEETIINFFELVRPIYDKMYTGENKNLAKARDALLPKLLSGELAVAGA